ncbi:MAG: hypothetical protein KDD28_15270 [Phaeodactylibacter sp.]|nr:hypothetical protein [Phaeodactylibacter sp.]
MKVLQLFFDFWFAGASLSALVLIAYYSSKKRKNYARIKGDNNKVVQN